MNEEKLDSMIYLRPHQDASIRKINSYFRDNDTSHLWPINNRFDVTERAIRRLRKTGTYNGGLVYYLALDAEISQIVNAEV